jgi:hypothetical protein
MHAPNLERDRRECWGSWFGARQLPRVLSTWPP